MKEGRIMHTSLKMGEIIVEPEEEKTLWWDMKRITIFAIPYSFTRYYLTEARLIVESGIFNKKEEEVRLYRVRDIMMQQSPFEQITKTGTIIITAADASTPILKLQHIPNTKAVKEAISQQVEKNRMKYGVRASELIGGDIVM